MAKFKFDIERELAEFALKYLDIPTLETRKSDSLDFHDVAVWQVKRALEEAFLLGRRIERIESQETKRGKR